MAQATQADIDRIVSEPARVARLWGQKNWDAMTDLKLVECIENGLPLSAFVNVARHLGGDSSKSVEVILSPSTYARAKRAQKKRLSKEMSERLYGITRVVGEAERVWKDDEAAMRRFLHRPHPLFEGRTPLDLARESTAGADLVVRLIGRARAGVAV